MAVRRNRRTTILLKHLNEGRRVSVIALWDQSEADPGSFQAKYRASVEALLPYLSDLRRKVSGALTALQITSSEVARESPLSEASIDEVFVLPNAPPASLTPQQLFRYAQIVDTALFKSYLVARPGLLGPLCRLDNWCEVSEVEAVLRERGVRQVSEYRRGTMLTSKTLVEILGTHFLISR